MEKHDKINYIEFPAKSIEAAKDFFKAVFGWSFVDYGPEYSSFQNAGIDGGETGASNRRRTHRASEYFKSSFSVCFV